MDFLGHVVFRALLKSDSYQLIGFCAQNSLFIVQQLNSITNNKSSLKIHTEGGKT